MKVAILAGGAGTRLAEETEIKPKPMVEIGGQPILWHIMMHYAHFGFNEFVIALGYKGDYIKRWAREYSTLSGNMTVHTGTGEVKLHGGDRPEWRIDLVDTGNATLTGGRIKRLRDFLGDSTFMLTWGDGVSDVDLRALLAFHRSHGKLATVTAVRPPARYGYMEFAGDCVSRFTEKPQTAEGWINGAFFVLEPKVLDYIDGDDTQFETRPARAPGRGRPADGVQPHSFWQCMDTLRDKHVLQKLWDSGSPPWKIWS